VLNQGDGTVARMDVSTGKRTALIEAGIPVGGGEITFCDGRSMGNRDWLSHHTHLSGDQYGRGPMARQRRRQHSRWSWIIVAERPKGS
jgi:hypothetical protein